MDRMIHNAINCTGHVGVRYIDPRPRHCDVRTVCDRCGKEEYQIFVGAAKIDNSQENCIHHGCPIQNDMLGKFCVYCIIDRTAKTAEAMGYEITGE